MAFTDERMDDLRHDAMVEARLDAEYFAHESHVVTDDDCWLCVEDAEDAAA